jgi:hypothetical protein
MGAGTPVRVTSLRHVDASKPGNLIRSSSEPRENPSIASGRNAERT